MFKMPNNCLLCESAITPTTPSIKCNGQCRKHVHTKCINLPQHELTIILSNKSQWHCDKCKNISKNDENIITINLIKQIITKQLEAFSKDLKKSINDHFTSLNNRISAVENHVANIQSEWEEFKRSTSQVNVTPINYNYNDVITEIEERKKRSSNVVLYNIPESTATNISQKVNDDLNHVMEILSSFGTFEQPKKVIRIGGARPNYVRPIKIIYKCEDDAKKVLRTNKENKNRNHHFKPDLTTIQRDYNKAILEEFKAKTSDPNHGLTLKYKNNTPYIANLVNNTKKSINRVNKSQRPVSPSSLN